MAGRKARSTPIFPAAMSTGNQIRTAISPRVPTPSPPPPTTPRQSSLIQDRLELVSSNGLRVKHRSSHSITLGWAPDSPKNVVAPGFGVTPAVPSTSHAIPGRQKSQKRSRRSRGPAPLVSSVGITNLHTSSTSKPDLPDVSAESAVSDEDGEAATSPWYEVQMKKSSSGEECWQTVYKGYGTKVDVKNLRPDTNLVFRMKTNQDGEWGSQIIAATDIAPPSADELQRAVDCNALGMVLRIIGACKDMRRVNIINSLDRKGQSPLMLAATNKNLEMMSVLLNADADPNLQAQNTGKTALMVSVGNGDIECVKLLLSQGASIIAQDKSGATSIHYGVISGVVSILQLLLSNALEAVNKADFGGWTPLLRAVAGGSSFKIVRTLLSYGADPNAKDNANSKSCLMVAASQRDSETLKIVQALLGYNADPTYRNSNGMSVLEMAKASGRPEVVEILVAACQAWTPGRPPVPSKLDSVGTQPDTVTTLVEPRPKQPFGQGSQTLDQRLPPFDVIPKDDKPSSATSSIQRELARSSFKSSSIQAKEDYKQAEWRNNNSSSSSVAATKGLQTASKSKANKTNASPLLPDLTHSSDSK